MSQDRLAELDFYHGLGDFEPPLQILAGFSPQSFSFWLCHTALLHVFFHEEGHLWAGHFAVRRNRDVLEQLKEVLVRSIREEGHGDLSEEEFECAFELRANLIAGVPLGEAAVNQRRSFPGRADGWEGARLDDARRAHFLLGDVMLAFANAANLAVSSVQRIEAGGDPEALRNLSFFGAAGQTAMKLRQEDVGEPGGNTSPLERSREIRHRDGRSEIHSDPAGVW